MPKYILAGRNIPDVKTKAQGVPDAPCIFCGTSLKHFNDGGVGWLLGAVVDGKRQFFLYCDQPPCSAVDYSEIWRCGCESDYVENVGERCHMCFHRREARLLYDDTGFQCSDCTHTWIGQTLERAPFMCPKCLSTSIKAS
jgi:hypothetical protein